MSDIKWQIIKHGDTDLEMLIKIAGIKDQHWTHGIDSQIEWINKNIRYDDYHLLGYVDEKTVAYISIVHVNVSIDEKLLECLGIGNVCVDVEFGKNRLGSRLVCEANRFILDSGFTGILLCKSELIPFYKKNGWNVLEYNEAIVAGIPYDKIVMILENESLRCSKIVIDKNF
mgnify:CR=1 FL=1